MGEPHVTSSRKLRLASSVRRLLTPGRSLSIEEQIQAAADRYEAEVRAAGARYDAAMVRIYASLRAGKCALPDDELSAAEPRQLRVNVVARRESIVMKYDEIGEE